LPAHVSRAAPPGGRGTAIAVYSTAQFLGAFCGGALGGFLIQHFGRGSLFTANTIMLVIWFVVATKMRIIGNSSASKYPIPPVDRDQVI
jgi:MFS family permease